MQITFFDLPAELRDRIYGLAVVDSNTIVPYFSIDRIRSPYSSIFRGEPGLLRTNRQIHGEVLPVFYGSNRFRLNNTSEVASWLKILGPHRTSLLQSVHDYEGLYTSHAAALKVIKTREVFTSNRLGRTLANGVLCVEVLPGDRILWSNGHMVMHGERRRE